jgi:hypothetical protein
MEKLYDYLIHYNPYTKLWSAVPRDLYPAYWSNRKVEGVISSKKIKTLIELICKGEEFIKSIE